MLLYDMIVIMLKSCLAMFEPKLDTAIRQARTPGDRVRQMNGQEELLLRNVARTFAVMAETIACIAFTDDAAVRAVCESREPRQCYSSPRLLRAFRRRSTLRYRNWRSNGLCRSEICGGQMLVGAGAWWLKAGCLSIAPCLYKGLLAPERCAVVVQVHDSLPVLRKSSRLLYMDGDRSCLGRWPVVYRWRSEYSFTPRLYSALYASTARRLLPPATPAYK